MNDRRRIALSNAQPVEIEGGSQDIVLDFGRIFSIIRRGWWLIGGLGFLGALIAAILVLQVTPIYQSGAQMLLGQKSRIDDTMGALFEDLRLDEAAISGEIAIITSGRILSAVTQELDLDGHPEFNADLRPPEPEPNIIVRAADGAVDILKVALGMEISEEAGGPPDFGSNPTPIQSAAMTGRTALGDQTDYVKQLRRDLRVSQVGRSNVLSIRYTSTDRLLAAAVPNVLIDIYLEDQVDRQFELVGRVTSGLETRLNEMRDRLEASERATIDFRTESLSEGFGSRQQLDQRLGDLAARLSEATVRHSELKAELDGLNRLIADQGAVATAGLFASPIIDGLRQELADLRRRADRLRVQFGPDIPQLSEAREEIGRVENTLTQEVLRLRDDKAKTVELSDAGRLALANQMIALEERAIEQAQREVTLTQLQREQDAARMVYRSFLDRFNETRESGDLQESDAQVIDYAVPPPEPIAPNKKLTVALGGVAGGFLGLALAFLHAFTDSRLRTLDRLQPLMRGADLVLMPRIPRGLRRQDPLAVAMNKPKSPLAESLRTLRSQLLLSTGQTVGTVVSFVSTRPGAGKTTTSINMGRLLAKMGLSCVIIDADQRRGNVAKTLRLPTSPDLVDVMNGNATLSGALQQDRATDLFVLTTRIDDSDPSGALLSRRLSEVIDDLKRRFDVIIIDTAPLLPVADALPAARLSDQVVMMLPYGTSEDDVRTGRRTLDRAGAPPTCAVMSFAPPNMIFSYY
ncbi:MAG: polysaccharide biosynthesis tyrosine autokinase [Pseudomonadota bacterium]